MKKIFLIAFITITASSAFAQDKTSYQNMVKKMLEANGSEGAFKAGIKQMFSMFREQKSNVPSEVWNSFEAEFEKTSMDDLSVMLAPVYEKHLTEADLKKIIEFYETPAGKKFATATPLIMQESMQVGQEWGMKIAQQVMKKLEEKGY